jgi:orotidine-5'-phosphate decarboxylase
VPAATTAISAHPADRLLQTFERVGAPICVGLDPVFEKLPATFRGSAEPQSKVEAIRLFALGVLEAIEPFVGCVKIQSACFERFGWPGVSAMEDVAAAARARSMIVIYDAKRGDIGVTAEHYAACSGHLGADWTTLNSYLGVDAIEPFLQAARGAFALVRTSNPSGDALQSLRLADGRTVAEAVADAIAALGGRYLGQHGFSALGAVVGATKRADAAALRSRMPKQIFLVPGYGAQGGGVDDVLPCFHGDGSGAIVTASRSILYPDSSAPAGGDWRAPIARAAEAFRREIRSGLGL